MSASPILLAALAAYEAGLCPMPPRQDGTKAPIAEWKQYQSSRPGREQIEQWFATTSGLGLICGEVSGGLELFEFEGRAVRAGLFGAFLDAANENGLGPLVERIAAGYSERSPAGGMHFLYRCAQSESTKLARAHLRRMWPREGHRAFELRPLIETKGQGGFVVVAPSNGKVHATRRPWVLVRGGFDTIATISTQERAELHRLARSFDRQPKPAPRGRAQFSGHLLRSDSSRTSPRPGDDYEATVSWSEILEPMGWTRLFCSGGNEHWRRAGKSNGTSATISHDGAGVLFVFSTSTPFEPEQPYTRFGAYAQLHHDGDFAAAARALAAQGYGEQRRPVTSDEWIRDAPEDDEPDPPDEEDQFAPLEATAPRHREPEVAEPSTRQPIDPTIAQLVAVEFGVEHPDDVSRIGTDLVKLVHDQRMRQLARQVITDERAAREQSLDRIHVVGGADFLAETSKSAEPLLGELVSVGHNATITARYKVGKTTFVENAIAALVTGGMFLGYFEVARPWRVVLMNYELTEDDERDRIRALDLPPDALERLRVINLRGTRLSLTTPSGRNWLVSKLVDHGAEALVMDTYGPASAPSVEHENDNAGNRRFQQAFDAIKAESDCRSALITLHTGRAVIEGEEHARGATVVDDWSDVRLILTKTEDGTRFLSSEGRNINYALPESPLAFDPASRGLFLPQHKVGTSRRKSRQEQKASEGVDAVVEAIEQTPGINAGELSAALHDAGFTTKAQQSEFIRNAQKAKRTHTHRDVHQVRHYSGPQHGESEPCR